jgi:uncharacterized protein YbjT (DUF2867 family)
MISANPMIVIDAGKEKPHAYAAVTGAFSYSGKYITRRLLAQGTRVINITGSSGRPDPFNGSVKSTPYHFDDPRAMEMSLHGVDTLYNTYWVRFDHASKTFEKAVKNTKTLLQAARNAGVQRIVHISITNPDEKSPLPYFQGKARLEHAVQSSGLSCAILRPTVIFGQEDILINNIAWLLRRFPFFAMPGDGSYALQPIYVEDIAGLAVQAGGSSENFVMDAVGPEIFSFKELVHVIAETVESRARIIPTSPEIALFLSRMVGALIGDVVLTRDEVKGLMSGLLVSNQTPTGTTSIRTWLYENRQTIGADYASLIKRHYR